MSRYSADELLKNKPTQIEEIEFEGIESGKSYIMINYATVFANRYEIVYYDHSVSINFFNNNVLVAKTDATGSNECKEDEAFIIDCYGITSETSHRIMTHLVNRYKENKVE